MLSIILMLFSWSSCFLCLLTIKYSCWIWVATLAGNSLAFLTAIPLFLAFIRTLAVFMHYYTWNKFNSTKIKGILMLFSFLCCSKYVFYFYCVKVRPKFLLIHPYFFIYLLFIEIKKYHFIILFTKLIYLCNMGK